MSEKTGNYKLSGGFAPTFYRILDEGAAEWKEEARTEALLTVGGTLIARVTPSFKRQLDIEGSARLRDGRIVNIHQKIDGSWRYMVARNAPFGLGLDGYKLIPYRTLAVDPEVIRPGTVLYLPALDGVRLPSGEIHDGFMFAHDEGQGIKGNRIDVFVGYESDVDNTLTRSGRIEDMNRVEVYQVDDETARRLNMKYRRQFAR
jgi:3D (Asp-Asp-Asp) domain-containing protein